MASLDSSIRSAARATSSAYRRLPIRWRLAGGSAALTLVILCGFAAIVGVLTTRQIHEDFHDEVAAQRRQARSRTRSCGSSRPTASADAAGRPATRVDLDDFAASQNAAIRVITEDDLVGFQTPNAPDFGAAASRSTFEVDGWRVETRPVAVVGYRRPLVRSSTRARSPTSRTPPTA